MSRSLPLVTRICFRALFMGIAESATKSAVDQTILTINGFDISFGTALLGFAVAVVSLLVTIAAIAARASNVRAVDARDQMRQSEFLAQRVAELARIQAETAGRLQALGEGLGRPAGGTRPGDGGAARCGVEPASAIPWTKSPGRPCSGCKACTSASPSSTMPRRISPSCPARSPRCAMCSATSRRAAPSGSRAWKTIIADGLPNALFAFQYTLSNNTRPDCVIFLPDQRPLVDRRQVSARGRHGAARIQDRRSAPARRPADAPGRVGSTLPISRKNTCCPAKPRTWRCCSCRRNRFTPSFTTGSMIWCRRPIARGSSSCRRRS